MMHFVYEKIENTSEGAVEKQQHCLRTRPAAMILVALTTFLSGVVFGRTFAPSEGIQTISGLLGPLGNQVTVFHYNKTFGMPPSDSVDATWASIFPVGRGFVHHPEIASNVSGIAVFHELHCLNALRIALYNTQGGQVTESGQLDESRDLDPKLHHVRHCIDYLRQSLMCHADTSFEPVNWKAGGVTGWGSERRCRDYQAVVDWAVEFRTHNQSSIS